MLTGPAMEGFALRKEFCQFSEADAGRLARLRDIFEAHADRMVDRFYQHLSNQPELKRLLRDESMIRRLKRSQREYLLSLASGRYDDRYAATRTRIGEVHDRIGLQPQWYVGTYGVYLDMLLPLVHEQFQDDPLEAMRTAAALNKLLILDMQLALDAYYGAQRRRAVERSEQLAAVGELAASIAHEVRNPLAGMKGALEILREDLAAKPANREILDELLAQIVRLETLVRDLLNYAHQRQPDRHALDLHEMLDRIVRNYQDQADVAGITVHRVYGPGSGSLSADPGQLEQVFFNLIQNAIQAMDEGGTLTVTTASEDGWMLIEFRDTGRGIPERIRANIFQAFFTTRHRGSGLGLPIVRKLVEAHGGTIEIDSGEGRGSVARVRLPTA